MKLISKVSNVNILLVEDNPADSELTIDALKEARINVNVHVVEDGEKALKFLHNEGSYITAPKPDIILLDLNLPGMYGASVLEIIRSNKNLKSIPVVVLSTSSSPSDVSEVYELYANSYINKPINLDHFYEVISQVVNYWFSITTLPSSKSVGYL